MSNQSFGGLVIALGIALVLLGLLIYVGGLSWFGRLPGDIRSETESVRFYLPITSMVLISLVLSALLYVIRRLF